MKTVSTYVIWWEDENGSHCDMVQALSVKQAIEILGCSIDSVTDVAKQIKNWR